MVARSFLDQIATFFTPKQSQPAPFCSLVHGVISLAVPVASWGFCLPGDYAPFNLHQLRDTTHPDMYAVLFSLARLYQDECTGRIKPGTRVLGLTATGSVEVVSVE